MNLNPQQRRAGLLEFGIGVPANAALAAVLYYRVFPVYPHMDTAAQRVVFAIQCNALPGLAMLVALYAVALGRATSKAIDPLIGAESRTLTIHGRFLTNTHEQLALFFVASLATSTFLNAGTLRVLPVAACLFFVNRFVFWIGYLKDPLLRGIGLSGTLYPITFLMLFAAYRTVGLWWHGR